MMVLTDLSATTPVHQTAKSFPVTNLLNMVVVLARSVRMDIEEKAVVMVRE